MKSRLLLGLVARLVVGGLALHLLGLRAEHGFALALRLPLAVLRVVLLARLLAVIAVITVPPSRVGPVITPSSVEKGTMVTLSCGRRRWGSMRAASRTKGIRRAMLWLVSMSSV